MNAVQRLNVGGYFTYNVKCLKYSPFVQENVRNIARMVEL